MRAFHKLVLTVLLIVAGVAAGDTSYQQTRSCGGMNAGAICSSLQPGAAQVTCMDRVNQERIACGIANADSLLREDLRSLLAGATPYIQGRENCGEIENMKSVCTELGTHNSTRCASFYSCEVAQCLVRNVYRDRHLHGAQDPASRDLSRTPTVNCGRIEELARDCETANPQLRSTCEGRVNALIAECRRENSSGLSSPQSCALPQYAGESKRAAQILSGTWCYGTGTERWTLTSPSTFTANYIGPLGGSATATFRDNGDDTFSISWSTGHQQVYRILDGNTLHQLSDSRPSNTSGPVSRRCG